MARILSNKDCYGIFLVDTFAIIDNHRANEYFFTGYWNARHASQLAVQLQNPRRQWKNFTYPPKGILRPYCIRKT